MQNLKIDIHWVFIAFIAGVKFADWCAINGLSIPAM